jgi:hypothetical protein
VKKLKDRRISPKKLLLAAIFSIVTISYPLLPASGAKYAGEPFYLGVGAQALGMGSAFSAASSDVTAGFWNPAGLTGISGKQAAFMHAETFGSLLNHDYMAFAMPLGSSGTRFGGISLTRLGGGGVKITEWDLNTNRPRIIREESHADYQLIFSYALNQKEKLSFGANAKFIYRDIPTSSAYGLGADIGMKYAALDFLTAAVVVKDFTTTLLSYDTGTKESINPTLTMGFMLRHQFGNWEAMLTADSDFRFENLRDAAEFWMGSISADTHWGAQLGYKNLLFARSGIDIGRMALGGGVKILPFQIDFAYLKYNDLDDSFRVSALFFWK